MLDQSFSAHNFERIYRIESEKGTIDIKSMPKEYREVLTASESLKKIVSGINQKKNYIKDDDLQCSKVYSKLENLKKKKEDILHDYLGDISKQINDHDFKFSLNKFETEDNKEVFTLGDSHEQFFIMKQLQNNIRYTFKVKQSNRHSILSNIKTFLNSSIPVYVIRTDITDFYESIPHKQLMPMIFENTLLSYKSKAFIKMILGYYEREKNKSLFQQSCGVPRGIGISPYLSELFMREIDTEIASRKEVMFYARYVDDIFIILNSLPTGVNLYEYYENMTKLFMTFGLSLKQPDDESDKCRIIDFTRDIKDIKPMNYLGYCLYMDRIKKNLSVSYGLSDKKKSLIRYSA